MRVSEERRLRCPLRVSMEGLHVVYVGNVSSATPVRGGGGGGGGRRDGDVELDRDQMQISGNGR